VTEEDTVAAEYKVAQYEDISVYYKDHLDGGGTSFGQDYLRVVPKLPAKPRTVFEWCSGPAFIAFSLLAHRLCDRLCLADFNPEAVEACRRTVEANNLADRVSVHHSDCFDSIPSHEKWDLVVGNPPHAGTDEDRPWGAAILYKDVDWAIHRKFWSGVHKFLNRNAIVLVQEACEVSSVSVFAPMIEKNGMRIVYVADSGPPFNEGLYYIGAVRMEDALDLRGTLAGLG
jgi:methylase of polypeptide subunit release factors